MNGVFRALSDPSIEGDIVLIGNREAAIQQLVDDLPDCEFIDVPDHSEKIKADPLSAGSVSDSAIRTALRMHRDGDIDAVISAGSTGAQVVASIEELDKCPGITRPAIGTFLPTAKEQLFLLDVGGSLVATPHQLVQFAVMGHVYASQIRRLPEPRIGVLNVARESNLGERNAIEAHSLLSDSGFNFIGFVEARDILAGVADVVVTNGFVGNSLLKFLEGLPILMRKFCEDDMIRKIEKKLDYQSNGGEPLLGVNGLSMVCHGASTATAIAASIKKSFHLAPLKLHEKLESFLVDKFASYFSQVKYLRSFRRSFKWFFEQSESDNKH